MLRLSLVFSTDPRTHGSPRASDQQPHAPPTIVPGTKAAEQLRAEHPAAEIEVLQLDAADGASIGALAAAVQERYSGKVDVLVRREEAP